MVADGWRRWEPFFAATTLPVTLALISALRLRPGMRVLDIGGGIGDPSLPIASIVGSDGHVISVDLSPKMIEIAKDRARALGLHNVEFLLGTVEDLEMSAGLFDAIVSRFALNFLRDMQTGLARLLELLVPGGRLAASVWGSPEVNPMFRIPREQLARFIDVRRQPPRGTPGPLWMSKPGELAGVLAQAGFEDVESMDVTLYNFARDPEEYVRMVYETAPMFRRAFNGLSGDQQRCVREGFIEAVAAYDDGGVIRVPAVVRLACGTRRGGERGPA